MLLRSRLCDCFAAAARAAAAQLLRPRPRGRSQHSRHSRILLYSMTLVAALTGEWCELGPFDGALCTLCARLGTPAAIREDQREALALQVTNTQPLRQLLRRFSLPHDTVRGRDRSRSPRRNTELSPTLPFPEHELHALTLQRIHAYALPLRADGAARTRYV